MSLTDVHDGLAMAIATSLGWGCLGAAAGSLALAAAGLATASVFFLASIGLSAVTTEPWL